MGISERDKSILVEVVSMINLPEEEQMSIYKSWYKSLFSERREEIKYLYCDLCDFFERKTNDTINLRVDKPLWRLKRSLEIMIEVFEEDDFED